MHSAAGLLGRSTWRLSCGYTGECSAREAQYGACRLFGVECSSRWLSSGSHTSLRLGVFPASHTSIPFRRSQTQSLHSVQRLQSSRSPQSPRRRMLCAVSLPASPVWQVAVASAQCRTADCTSHAIAPDHAPDPVRSSKCAAVLALRLSQSVFADRALCIKCVRASFWLRFCWALAFAFAVRKRHKSPFCVLRFDFSFTAFLGLFPHTPRDLHVSP